MRRYVIRRLIGLVPVLLGVIFVTMLTIELIPGDPVAIMLGENARQEQVEALRAHLGLDQPFPVRYVKYVGNVLTGDLGRSIQTNRSVLAEIADVWPNTLLLAIAAMALAIVVGITVGIISAIRPYGLIDTVARVVALIGLSMPIFWLALMLQSLFAVHWQLLPSAGMYTIGDGDLGDRLRHLVLPASILSVAYMASWGRFTRASMLDVFGLDYIRTARAKGLGEVQVIYRHALRNALVPVITIVALDFAGMISGAVITETIFAWPGMGRLFIESMNGRDYPVLMALLMIGSFALVAINLITDIVYSLVDARIRYD